MSNILNAVKGKVNKLKQNGMLRIVLISAFALLLIVSLTVAWYINSVGLYGMKFSTGDINFNAYVYDGNGNYKIGPVSSDPENESKYINTLLIPIENAQIGSVATAYIAVESTGSLGIQYRIAFDIAGRNESSTAYLGGYKYNISKVTDSVDFDGANDLGIENSPKPESIDDEVVTIDRNAINGTIEDKNGYNVYRIDFTLVHKNIEYTGNEINIYFNIFATQIDGSFDDNAERGYTYYCSSQEDIDRARVEAYPGDIIKLSSDIIYYGDLVFNKPVNLEMNNYTLTVNGNLMYDYVLSNSLRIDAGGLGRIVVGCSKEGVGGNFQIKAPIGDVSLIGSNSSSGDIAVEKNIIIDATNSVGSAGVSFNEVKISDLDGVRKDVQLESNTRATVAFDTTVSGLMSVVGANNIEIINNGVIEEIDLSQMALLDQTNSPQIYILNNNDIGSPIKLPSWSVKFVVDGNGKCSGNTRIIQSYSGGAVEVEGSTGCDFDNDDIEIERKDFLVEQIQEGNDSRLKIYYQDIEGEVTTIQSILEDYLENVATTGCKMNEVVQLEIICVGVKSVTNADIAFMNSNDMQSLKHLDLERANLYDENKSGDKAYNRLCDGAFRNVSKYETLLLPRNLVEIGDEAFKGSKINNIVTIPSGVKTFGSEWFADGNYVRFAASLPNDNAVPGLTDVKAIFVDEAYIGSYKARYSAYATRIYPTSVLDETKTHFVRNTTANEWEITYYITGEESTIGNNITIDGTILNITSVYDNAYRHNYSGKEVKFADSVAKVGEGNFADNTNIKKVDLNKVRSVGDEAFAGATRLADVLFGEALETIGAKAFLNCASLSQKIILPETMESIGKNAFQKTTITAVNTGGTTFVDEYAFAGCTSLVWAELPKVQVVGVEGGKNSLFAGCSSLVSVKMPALYKANGNLMFDACISLREIYMAADDEGVSLGSTTETFTSGCDLTKIKMFVPAELVEMYRARVPGGVLASTIYPEGEKLGEQLIEGFNIGNYIVRDNGNNTYTLITSNLDYVNSLAIPETYQDKPITKIYSAAFKNQNLTNVTVTLGKNLEVIGSSAFEGIKGLHKVEFEQATALKEIEASAFASCTNLVQDVNLPDSMERIGAYAFSGTKITGVNTGGTMSIETRAFEKCASITYVIMPEVTTIAESGTNYVFDKCTSLVSVDMPKVTKVYGSHLFNGCTSLMELYMAHGDSDVTLGTSALNGIKTGQVKLFVPEDLVTTYKDKVVITATQIYPKGEKLGTKTVKGILVGDYIVLKRENGYSLVTTHLDFAGDVTLPNEYNEEPIVEIYTNAFRNQTFTNANLTLGSNMQKIGTEAFHGRSGLVSIVMNEVTTIGNGAFTACGLRVLNAPKATEFASSAFLSCKDLETASIPRAQKITEPFVFRGCSGLKAVYFEDIIQVANTTFFECTSVERIIINRLINSDGSNMPKTMHLNDSSYCPNSTIYVPYLSKNFYGDEWSGRPVATFDISATGGTDTYILSDNNGRYTLIDFIPGDSSSSVVIPATVNAPDIGDVPIHTIGNNAFSSVFSTVRDLTLSSSIAQLEDLALSEFTSLENIYVDANSPYFASVGGVLYSGDGRLLVKYPVGRPATFDMTEATYASTVAIGANAFKNATNLSRIVFPGSLAVIDSEAFAGCTKLKTVEFTSTTPPTLMGVAIFDTSIDGFKMVIPTTSTEVVAAYLSAYNFSEYEPYIDLNGMEKPTITGIISSIFGISKIGVRGQQVANSALSYVGCAYVYGGTSPEGFDCSGFVQYVYKENGIDINRTASAQLADGFEVAYDDMQPGDVIFFGTDGTVTHVGIYVGDGNFVHAQNSDTGVVITNLSESYYANRFLYAHRMVS